ncbi:MAG: hypothetical protein PHU75_09155 [Candidatus Nanopelagicales bacterium]|nr:hypothetical protein [Candidatus Nanopelagicales bacterium]
MAADNDMRASAAQRALAQVWIKRVAVASVVVWVACIGIWYLMGADSEGFWPLWTMYGLGAVLMFLTWVAYGPRREDPPKEPRR